MLTFWLFSVIDIAIFHELLIDAFANMAMLIRYYFDYFPVFVLATFGRLV